jgi:multiple sugar transport system substrate-binding protein
MKPRITEQPFVDALARRARSEPSPVTVPVLGTGDRLVGITNTSRNATTAFQLMEWLASGDISTQLALSAPGQLPARRSQLTSPDWFDAKLGMVEREALGKRIERSFSTESYVQVPRIPGVDRYLTALHDAERAVENGELEPRAALEKAAAKWEAITDELGRESQWQAYAKHLGIAEH